MCQFVTNFLRYVSAKYYLNWLTVGKVTIKIKSMNFLLRHSVESVDLGSGFVCVCVCILYFPELSSD